MKKNYKIREFSQLCIAAVCSVWIVCFFMDPVLSWLSPVEEIAVIASGEKNELSQGTRLQLTGVYTNGGLNDWETTDILECYGWQKEQTESGREYYAAEQAAKMIIRVKKWDATAITLSSDMNSGIVTIETPKHTRSFDLLRPQSRTFKFYYHYPFAYMIRIFLLLLFTAAGYFLIQKFYAYGAKWKLARRVLCSPPIWIVMLAIAFRKIYFRYTIVTTFPDTGTYYPYPYNIFKGQVSKNRPPVYPYFIKLIKHITGQTNQQEIFLSVAVAQTVVALISVILFYYVVRYLLRGHLFAVLSTVIYACHPYFINWERVILTESLTISGAVLLLFLLTRYLKKPSRVWALLSVLCTLLLSMLRPAFLAVFLVVGCFFILRFFLAKQERKRIAAGFAGIALTILSLSGYSLMNQKNNGVFHVSDVERWNQVWMFSNQQLYYNPDYPKSKKTAIKTTFTNPDAPFNCASAVLGQLSYAESKKYILSTLLHNICGYTEYTTEKILAMLNRPVGTVYVKDTPNLAFNRLNRMIGGIFFSITFGQTFGLLGIEVLYGLAKLIYKKRFPWISAGIVCFIAAVLAPAFIGVQGEWQRLSCGALPFILVLVALYFDRITTWGLHYFKEKTKEI